MAARGVQSLGLGKLKLEQGQAPGSAMLPRSKRVVASDCRCTLGLPKYAIALDQLILISRWICMTKLIFYCAASRGASRITWTFEHRLSSDSLHSFAAAVQEGKVTLKTLPPPAQILRTE